jgi:hypothetical protein
MPSRDKNDQETFLESVRALPSVCGARESATGLVVRLQSGITRNQMMSILSSLAAKLQYPFRQDYVRLIKKIDAHQFCSILSSEVENRIPATRFRYQDGEVVVEYHGMLDHVDLVSKIREIVVERGCELPCTIRVVHAATRPMQGDFYPKSTEKAPAPSGPIVIIFDPFAPPGGP